jgi:uncharacterized protein
MNPELRAYVEESIIPLYDRFDKGHRRDHARSVISQALELARHYDVDEDMVYAAAAWHDTGLRDGRETHHIVSAQIIRSDPRLPEWFSKEEIDTIADAAEDHRASSDHEPRTIYGRIIAEADRLIDPVTVVRRTVQYSLIHYPELDKDGHWQRCRNHLKEKYGEGGYLKLWIPESPNALRLGQLREIIADTGRLRAMFDIFYGEEK